MVTTGACQLVGGIDARSLGAEAGPGEGDAGPGSDATIGSDTGGGDAGRDTATGTDAPNWACTPGTSSCNGRQPLPCNSAGQWGEAGAVCPNVCSATVDGGCTGVCFPGATGCDALQAQTCNDAGQWVSGMLCTGVQRGKLLRVLAGGPAVQRASTADVRRRRRLAEHRHALPLRVHGRQLHGNVHLGVGRVQREPPQTCTGGTWTNTGSRCACGCNAGACDTSYVAEVMCDDPIAYWRLDEPNGSTTAADRTGNYPGQYFGDVKFGQPGAIRGDPDTCVTLNSTQPQPMTGYVGVSQTLSEMLEFNGQAGRAPFSLEAWIQPTSVTSEYRGVLSNEYAGTSGKEGYAIYLGGFTSNGTGIGFERFQDGTSTVLQDAGAVTQNTGWYHVVATYDGSEMRLYVNAQQVASGSSSLAIQDFPCTFDIGATHCGAMGTNFQGWVDEVALYSTALSQARIQAHYDAAQ